MIDQLSNGFPLLGTVSKSHHTIDAIDHFGGRIYRQEMQKPGLGFPVKPKYV